MWHLLRRRRQPGWGRGSSLAAQQAERTEVAVVSELSLDL